MKRLKTKYRNQFIITINFKSEAVDIFTPKRFDSTAADFEKIEKIRQRYDFIGY